ncbi:hypothetical protein A3844_14090 [Paenibacillus helianthi]|uniref:Uncharacterized protein n=1 Tax=Paenibacillus helianthi TaxID=1349432 RepID=A0ABX3ERB7_9BACL|nr:hypothetical protein [Paenibacillus helianthi]OKP86195.1 hypothetical protein A3844_14090 [Paenibacillus helianthi]
MKNMKNAVSLSSAVRRTANNSTGSEGGKGRMKRKTGAGRPTKLSPSTMNVYIAPSLEGGDDEYKKLISGKVDNTKPSFA